MANGVFSLNDLPEDCLANVISYTSPVDACRLSTVNSRLRSAVESNQVWEKFLPADYRNILGRSREGIELLRRCTSKRQLYFEFCEKPYLIDDRTTWCLCFDKRTGEKTFFLGARELTINPNHWNVTCSPESRFGSVMVQQVRHYWTNTYIQATMNPRILSAGKRYNVYLIFRMVIRNFLIMAKVWVGFNGQKKQPSTVRHSDVRKRGDGWLEVKLGSVIIDGNEDDDVELGFNQGSDQYLSKGGYLVIEGIEVRVA